MAEFDPWGPLQGFLIKLNNAEVVAAAISDAGLPPSRQFTEAERWSHKTKVAALLEMTSQAYSAFTSAQKRQFVANVALSLAQRQPEWKEALNETLGRIGWQIIDNALVPISVLDASDLAQVPLAARADLFKAAERVSTDPSGAVTSACAAIDAVTADLYAKHSLGNVGDASFQEKVNKSLQAIGAFTAYENDLVQLGWEPAKAKIVAHNLKGSISQAAVVMQTLRSGMGDVHGTKPTLQHMVFESVKHAILIATVFKGAGYQ